MTTLHLSHTVASAAPALRALWLLGLPLAAGLRAAATDRRLIAAALFGAGAAALLPAALFEAALPVIITHGPGGGGGMAGLFGDGMRDLVLAGVAAAAALVLLRAGWNGEALPQGLLAGLFGLFHAAMIVPRHGPLSDALMPGLGGAADPLAPLVPLAPWAPWIAAMSLGTVVAIVLAARRTG